MARYNEILTGRHNRFFQKLFGLKGGPPAPQLSSEVQVVHPIFHGVENRFIESWNRFGSGSVAPALAASFTQLQIQNPAKSGIIAVIERLSFSEIAADEIFISISTGAAKLTGAFPIRSLDNRPTRGGATLNSACTVNAGNVPVAGGVIARLRISAGLDFNFILTDNQEIPLLPGDDLEVTTATQNVGLDCSLMWRERTLEESEQQ